MTRTRIADADEKTISRWRQEWEDCVRQCWKKWIEEKGKKDTTGFMKYIEQGSETKKTYNFYWGTRRKVMYGKEITPKKFFKTLGLPIGPVRVYGKEWGHEELCEIVYKILDKDKDCQKLKKKLESAREKYPELNNLEVIRKLENWLIEKKIRFPTRVRFPKQFKKKREAYELYEEACSEKDSEWYIPLLDKDSENYAPWLLFYWLPWGKPGEEKGRDLRVRAINWLVTWRIPKKPGEPTREEICSIIFKDFKENGLSGSMGGTLYKHPYDALAEAYYDRGKWNIQKFEMKEVPAGTWKDLEERKKFFAWITEKWLIFPADIKKKSILYQELITVREGDKEAKRTFEKITSIWRDHFDKDFSRVLKDWREALVKTKRITLLHICPKCKKSLVTVERLGIFKCRKCKNVFEVHTR